MRVAFLAEKRYKILLSFECYGWFLLIFFEMWFQRSFNILFIRRCSRQKIHLTIWYFLCHHNDLFSSPSAAEVELRLLSKKSKKIKTNKRYRSLGNRRVLRCLENLVFNRNWTSNRADATRISSPSKYTNN